MLARVSGISGKYDLNDDKWIVSEFCQGAAGDITRAENQRSVVYEIRDNLIYVPDSQRDELRVTLADEGSRSLFAA